MKVLLINPSEMTGEGGLYGPLTTPHMGLAYIASYLQSNGYEIRVIEQAVYKLSNAKVVELFKEFEPDIVGFTARSFNINVAYQLMGSLKECNPDILIILGGSHATALPAYTLNECSDIDVIVEGYGEESMLELVERYQQGIDDIEALCKPVAGVSYRTKISTVQNPPRSVIKDLDELPFPDYSLYDLTAFGKMYFPQTNKFQREISMFAGRGCPFKCTFCMAHGGEGIKRGWSVRTPGNVVDEMEYQLKNTGIDVFNFNDSTFGIKKKWFFEFCDEIKRRGLHKKIHWSFETRADLGSVELFKAAVSAGCNWVFFGFESGSDAVLEGSKKGITKQDIINATANARKAKVPYVSASFIVGLPYETKETIKETAEVIRTIKLDSAGINIVAMYPGTDIYEMAQQGEGGIRIEPWAEMNWDVFDRTRPHIRVNDLSGDDLVEAASYLKMVQHSITSQSSNVSLVKKSISYLFYYAIHDRKKLFALISQVMNRIIRKLTSPFNRD